MAVSKIEQFQKMEQKIDQIAQAYFSSLRHLNSGHVVYEGEDHSNLYSSYVERVQDAFALLDHVEKTFINNEFFFEDYPNWWCGIYSKTTFYRLKRIAMRHFLGAYKNAL